MTQHRNLAYGDRLPESLLDALEEFVGSYVSPNFALTLSTSTTVQVVAGIDNAQVSIAIDGRWRYNTVTISRAHPGGAAAIYDVWVVASDNSFVPGSPETDNTVYAFDMRIVAHSTTPVTGSGATALGRKVAEVTWDGAGITAINQLVGSFSPAFASDVVARQGAAEQVLMGRQALGKAGFLLGSAGDVSLYRDSATLLRSNAALELDGGAGSKVALAIPSTTLGTGITIGGDATLYRPAAATLQSDGAILATGGFGAPLVAAPTTQVLYASVAGDTQPRLQITAAGTINIGAGGATAPDVNLYRSNPNELKTDDSLVVALGLTVQGLAGIAITNGTAILAARSAATATTQIAGLRAAADAQDRLTIDASGTHQWGPGSAGGDTTLGRNAAGVLALGTAAQGGRLLIITAGGGIAYSARVTSDTNDRLSISGAGALTWGSGAALPDASLGRSSAGVVDLGTTVQAGKLRAFGSVAGSLIFAGLVTTDANERFNVGADGKQQWGPGTGAVDTNLYRSAVGTLTTDGAFSVGGAFTSAALGASGAGHAALAITSPTGGITFGGDTELYRSAASALSLGTDDTLVLSALGVRFANGLVQTKQAMPAYDLARYMGLMFCEGVHGGWSTDPQTVLVASAGTGLQVSVSAGYAFVQGDDAVGQGLYPHYNAAPLLAAVSSNASGNPRVDAVVLRFNDPEATGRTPADTPFTAHVEVIAGTPTSGATLVNLSGAATIPPSALLLAYLLVPNGAASFSGGSFLDQRKLAGPAIWAENSHRYRQGLDSTGTIGWEQIA